VKHLLSYTLFEKKVPIEVGTSMTKRARFLQKLIRGEISVEDVANRNNFDYQAWTQRIKDLDRIFLGKEFKITDALNLLYTNPEFLPAFLKFNPAKKKGKENKKQEQEKKSEGSQKKEKKKA
jgi:hypothetical protein